MTEDINYTKLINLIRDEKYGSALVEIKKLHQSPTESIQLTLSKLYCQIEAGKYRAARITVNTALEKHPGHHLLLAVEKHLDDLKIEKKPANPLNDFMAAFIKYNHSELSHANEKKFNKLMDQILVKPYIK